MSVEELLQRLENARRGVERKRGQRDALLRDRSAILGLLGKAKDDKEMEGEISSLLNKVSSISWTRTKDQFESLVDSALRAVFPDRNYKFVIHQEMKRGMSNVEFSVIEDDVETDIWEEGGLGVADVVGFALRVAYLALYRPKLFPLLVVDEPFRHLSAEYVPNVSRFVSKVSRDLGIQIVAVSHNSDLISAADQVFRLEKIDGSTKAVDQSMAGAA